MAFPDRIERTMEIGHPPRTVWTALTTADGLAAWFGEQAEIDLRPGGAAQMRWSDGSSVDMRVERVEEPAVFGFTYYGRAFAAMPAPDGSRTPSWSGYAVLFAVALASLAAHGFAVWRERR